MIEFALPNSQPPSQYPKASPVPGPIGWRHFLMMLAVMLATLFYVTCVTQWSSKETVDSARSVMTEQLVFKDDPNGDILIEVLPTPTKPGLTGESSLRFSGEQGFLRGTLRALARDRKVRHLSPEAPFELALHQDGHLSITDTLTHHGIDLEAFGPDNLAVFVKILQACAQATSPSVTTISHTNTSKENQ